MLFGVHTSISGGLSKSIKEAIEKKCETMQIFSRNPRGWGTHEFNPDEVDIFKKERISANISPLVIHMLYLPNLATANDELYEKSRNVLIDELNRSEILGAEYLVIHPGRYSGTTREIGKRQIINAINYAFSKIKKSVILLLENLAGGGTDIGGSFEELKEIIDGVKENNRLGICFDTCHAFAFGYDISVNGFDETIEKFDKIVGIDKLKMFHLNDSKGKFGSKIDRHQHIGKGEIGLKNFKAVVNHKLLKNLPGILETPKDSPVADKNNLAVLRKLIK